MKAPTILVVEDNAITRKMVRVALATEGYTVLEAPDGQTALELAAKAAPDLILQDLLLPDVDGFDLVGKLRALPAAADVPILAFSGFLSRPEVTRALAVGFTDFLMKPVEPSRLIETVKAYLPAPRPPAESPGVGRRILLVDDDPVQLKLSRIHMTNLGFQVTTAANGAEALDKARQSPPDSILSDVLMPGLDGFQLCLTIRQDPRLARIPVVLCSANYIEEADRNLAACVGASAMTIRTPDLNEAIGALLTSLDRKWAPAAQVPAEQLETERLRRTVLQLERQAAMNIELVQRASVMATTLSLLSALPETPASALSVEAASAEVLASLLDAGGISAGVLHLMGADGRLRLQAQRGIKDQATADAEEFFGHPKIFTRTLEVRDAIWIPSAAVPEEAGRDFLARAGVSSALILPLVSRGEPLGTLMLASNRRDLTQKDWRPFARSMAAQVAQTIALNRAFSELAASAQRYRSLFNNVPIGLLRSTADGQILEANPVLVAMLGFLNRESLLAAKVTDFYVRPEDRRRWQAIGEREGTVQGVETELCRRDGTIIWVRLNIRAIQEANGQVLYEASLEDITERKRVEEQLQRQREALMQTEKLAAMGELLAGVAHELNNPLSVVLGQTVLLREAAGSRPLAERVEKIAKAAERCARIVKNFLALARQRPPERSQVRLNQVVQEAVELLAYPLRVDSVELKLDLVRDLPVLWADPHQLHQVVVNLVTNAHHAIRATQPPRRLTLTTGFDPAQARVYLEVADTGPGIPPEIQRRVFEPFFTTKPPGQGTGLGLSLCQGIIEGHGGFIRVENQPGQGAVFRIELPVEAAPVVGPEARVAEALPPLRERVILVVDDEPEVAGVLADLLSADGHQVETAANGALALEKLQARAYDLILSDLRMPELDGPGLYREVARRHPELRGRVIFLTGDTLSLEIREFVDKTGAPSLSKPFAFEEVRRVVQRVLRGG